MADTARVLSGFYDGIEYRGFGQSIVEELARFASVPVWNGLTNEWHPTQILADFLTMREHCDKPYKDQTMAYIGDARYNMGNSLMIASAMLGLDFRSVAPRALWTSDEIYEQACAIAERTGARITVRKMWTAASRAAISCIPTSGSPWASRKMSGRNASTC